MSDISINSLLKEIKKLKDENKKLKSRKKYGLVWEEEKEPEQVVLDCQKKIPILKEIKNKELFTDKDKPVNILIEGDNYHSLQVLNYTHKGKVDVIYIDPPYNRGGDFIYNDKYVDKEDNYKHSKWLNFISKRLFFAKNILKNDGVIFISIDDAEFAQLNQLCKEIFGENKVDVLIWKKTGDSRDGKMKNTTTFRVDHEYIIVCYKNIKKLNKLLEKPNFKNNYPNYDFDPRGSYKAGSISRADYASNKNSKNYYTVISPSGKNFTRQFDISKIDFEKLNLDIKINKYGKKVSRIYWGKNDNSVPAIKIFVEEKRKITPYSVLSNFGTTTEGTKEVSDILNKDCSNMRPKPTTLISVLIQLALKNKNGIVLDFFAGTGTTGHSLLNNNFEYNKFAKFILCTNNCEKICSEYCYPRIKKIIKGYKNVKDTYIEGLGGNLKYYKTDFIDVEHITNVSDEKKLKLTYRTGELISIKEDVFEELEKNEYYQIFKSNKKIVGIYFVEDHKKLDKLLENINSYDLKKIVYLFSWGKTEYSGVDLGYSNIKIKDIPQPIIDVYKEINKL